MEITPIFFLFFAFTFVIGVVLGGMVLFLVRRVMLNREIRIAERKAARITNEAKTEAKNSIDKATVDADKIRTAAEAEHKERRIELTRQEGRLAQKIDSLDNKFAELERRDHNLDNKEKEIDSVRASVLDIKAKELKQLEIVASLTSDQAKELLLDNMSAEIKDEAARRLRDWEVKLKEETDKRTQEILTQAIQRSASEIVAETTVGVVPLPNDEMKGRLIGREGRNIRALEQATGVDLIIDDTPEAVTISSFDPVRREIARIALLKLVLDGRIHPARIEEIVAKAKEEVDASMQQAGEQAAFQAGVHGMRPELIKILGRLKYRTSYGQNVLAHSIEVAHLAGIIAGELGARVAIARKAGLLHDIGKAMDREVEGTHAAIGAELVKQWEKSPEVVAGVAEHHGETGNMSFWGYLISAADAISSARPGARRESLESYIKRLKALEDIANSFKGVEKSYAIQAGREVRILVKPDEIDDLAAVRLARDIVSKIQGEMEYPGQIKVTVLRETRAVDYAK
jgi:ribonuclease Y